MTAVNKAIVHRLYDELAKQNFSAVGELLAADYVSHTEESAVDKESFKATYCSPARRYNLDKRETYATIAEGDKVLMTGRLWGTLIPEGASFTVRSADIYRIKDGLIVEHWGVATDMEEDAQ